MENNITNKKKTIISVQYYVNNSFETFYFTIGNKTTNFKFR